MGHPRCVHFPIKESAIKSINIVCGSLYNFLLMIDGKIQNSLLYSHSKFPVFTEPLDITLSSQIFTCQHNILIYKRLDGLKNSRSRLIFLVLISVRCAVLVVAARASNANGYFRWGFVLHRLPSIANTDPTTLAFCGCLISN